MSRFLRSTSFFTLLLAGGLFFACNDDGQPDAELEIPDSYAAFENVSYAGQLERLAMLGEIKAYAKTAHDGAVLDSTKLAAMLANEAGAGFSGSYAKDIASKTLTPLLPVSYGMIGDLAHYSQLGAASTLREAGLHTATSNGNTYLLAANGVEPLQALEKGLMGSCFYYQAHTVYLGEDRMAADNVDVTPGEGTTREHYFDEAFGYFGVPKNFPADVDGVAFWGDYCNDRDEDLGTNKIMDAFLKARAAISASNAAAQDEAVEEVKRQWERVAMGSAIHYLNLAIEHEADPARRAHDLTEAIAFAQATGYSPDASISLTDMSNLVQAFAGASSWDRMDLHSVTNDNILTFRAAIAGPTGLTDQAENL